MMSTADQVVRFFEFSPAKQKTLEEIIAGHEEFSSQKQKLKELCRTRWVERHDALDRLIDFLPAVVDALASYAKLPNTRTPGMADASSLLHSICNFQFIVCLIIVRECLSLMQGLTRSLQERKLDVGCALKNVFMSRCRSRNIGMR